MSKYYAIFLNEMGEPAFKYPSELCATSKKEAYKFLSEDVAPEHIYGIYTENEFGIAYNSKNFSMLRPRIL